MKKNTFKNKTTLQDQPKVSVIVATYRRDKSLRDALNSLVDQTYKNIEVVIIDDNADPNWNNIVNEIVLNFYSIFNDNLIYIRNRKNEGSAETRNIGIEKATGKFITFLDDDDIYLKNKVKNQVMNMIENESDYSITDLWLYNDKGFLIEKRRRDYILNYSSKDLEKYHLMHHMTGTDVMMFKKSYLVSIGGFSKIDVGDEFYLMHKAIKANGKFSYLDRCDVKAFVHTEVNGLSSGDSKIEGEKYLFNYKKKFFDTLKNNEIRYIKMRHFAVLAFAELRRKKFIKFSIYSLLSFVLSPVGSIILVFKRKIK